MSEHQIKVLLVLGSGRNGSTLVGGILGSLPGITNIGEGHWIWDRGLGENRLCGCGSPIRSCEYWAQVFDRLWETAPPGPEQGAGLRQATLEGLAPLRLFGRRWRKRITAQQREYLELTGRLYEAVAGETGARLVVDSSKRPVYGLAMTRLAGIDLRLLHLIRDSRAVAFSWRRRKVNPDIPGGGEMRRHPAWKTAIGWSVWNVFAEMLSIGRKGRYLRIRYEDLARHPRSTLERIGMFVGENVAEVLSGDREASVSPSHSISGNPARFDVGVVAVREDAEWESAMSRRDRWITTALSWPLMVRYGYAFRRR